MTATKQRIIYLGTPQFAVKPVFALLRAGYQIPLVITQPPRPQGRKGQVTATPVQRFAEDARLPFLAVPNVNQPEVLAQIAAAKPDLLVVAAFGQLLSEELLQLAPFGAVNIHTSLLPEYRGAAPVQRALMDGRNKTGVTLMRIVKALDAGDIIDQAECVISSTDNTGSLREDLMAVGTDLLLHNLPQLFAGRLKPTPQDEALATYAAKITPADELLDWRRTAGELYNQLRGLLPETSAYTWYKDGENWQRLKMWQRRVAEACGNAAAPGTVFGVDADGLLVAAGEGTLHLQLLQPAGKGRMEAAAWWRGRRDLQKSGLRFAEPEQEAGNE